jgi:hypothetical protein
MDFVTGDSTLQISHPSESHPNTTMTCTSPGDMKWISIGLVLPEKSTVEEIIVCYQVSNPQSFISQIRLSEIKTPEKAIVRHKDVTDLKNTDPVCYISRVDGGGLVTTAAITLELELDFQSTGDKIMVGAIGIKIQSMTECVDTITKLRELIPALGMIPCVMVNGYHEPGDGGGGSFFWDSCFNVDLIRFPKGEDFGIVIKPDSVLFSRPGRWRRIYHGPISVKWFGALGNGTTNDTTAILAALTAVNAFSTAGAGATLVVGATLYFPAGVYICNSPLEVGQGVTLQGAGQRATQIVGRLTGGDSGKDFMSWTFATPYGRGGGLKDMWLQADTTACNLMLDLCSFTNWSDFIVENVYFGGGLATRFTLALWGCLQGTVNSIRAAGAISGGVMTAGSALTGSGSGSPPNTVTRIAGITTVRFKDCYFTSTHKGPGALVAGTAIHFSHCIFESNGIIDPTYAPSGLTQMGGFGFHFIAGQVALESCYFENNYNDDMYLGSIGGNNIVYITNPFFSSNRRIRYPMDMTRSVTTAPAVTVTGTPLRSISLLGLRIEITTGGAVGTARYKYSINNGRSFVGTNQVTDSTVLLPGTGITVHFPDGTYASDNVYVVPSTRCITTSFVNSGALIGGDFDNPQGGDRTVQWNGQDAIHLGYFTEHFDILGGVDLGDATITYKGLTDLSAYPGFIHYIDANGLSVTKGNAYHDKLRIMANGVAGPTCSSAAGSPEKSETALIGSQFLQTDAIDGNELQTKSLGTGNTGWVAPNGYKLVNYSSDGKLIPTAEEECARYHRVVSGVPLTMTHNYVLPLTIKRAWFIHNATSGGQSIQVIGTSGTGVTIAADTKAWVYTDGTNFY